MGGMTSRLLAGLPTHRPVRKQTAIWVKCSASGTSVRGSAAQKAATPGTDAPFSLGAWGQAEWHLYRSRHADICVLDFDVVVL